MKFKLNYFICILLFMLTSTFCIKKVYGIESFSMIEDASQYNNSVANTSRIIYPSCYISNTTTLKGMLPCVTETYPIGEMFSNENISLEEGKSMLKLNFAGRVDAWGNNTTSGNTSWKGITELGNTKIYPGMYLKFRRYDLLNDAVGSDFANTILYSYNTGQLEMSGASVKRLPKDTSGKYDSVSVDPNDFRIEDVKLEYTKNNWFIAYDVVINTLRANYSTLFGMSGISSGHATNTRAYHYYLPITIEMKYLSNPCLGDKSVAQQYANNHPNTCCYEYPETCNLCSTGLGEQTALDYAYANPGKCCDEYPETCCRNEEYVKSDKFDTKKNWQNAYCCIDSENYDIHYNEKDVTKSMLTFKNYFDASFIYEKCGAPIIISEQTNPVRCGNTKKELYTTSYITLDANDKLTTTDTTCVPGFNCDHIHTYTYTFGFKYKSKNVLTKKDFGYDYFRTLSDYKNYYKLKQTDKDSIWMVGAEGVEGVPIPTENYKKYSLKASNFGYEISDLTYNGNDEYTIKIKVSIYRVPGLYVSELPYESGLTAQTDETAIPLTAAEYKKASGGSYVPSILSDETTRLFYVPIKFYICSSGSSGGISGAKCNVPGDFVDPNGYCCNNYGETTLGKNYCGKCSNAIYYDNHKTECQSSTDDSKTCTIVNSDNSNSCCTSNNWKDNKSICCNYSPYSSKTECNKEIKHDDLKNGTCNKGIDSSKEENNTPFDIGTFNSFVNTSGKYNNYGYTSMFKIATEKMQIANYKTTYSEELSNVSAGTGFNYDFDVFDTITYEPIISEIRSSLNAMNDSSHPNQSAMQSNLNTLYQNYTNSFNSIYTNNIINKLTGTNDKPTNIYFKTYKNNTISDEIQYIVNNPPVKNKELTKSVSMTNVSIITKTGTATCNRTCTSHDMYGNCTEYNYYWDNSDKYSDAVSCSEFSDLGETKNLYNDISYSIPSNMSTQFSYSVKLPEYKVNQNDISNNGYTYSTTTKTGNGTNTTILNPISGGNKYYTSFTIKNIGGETVKSSSYLPFYISIKDAGISDNMTSTSEPSNTNIWKKEIFSCSYGAVAFNNINSNSIVNNSSAFIFRPISLTRPFPNDRAIGTNWFNQTYNSDTSKIKGINVDSIGNIKGDKVYTDNTPLYEITLTTDLINEIKKYNNYQENNGGYLDWNNITMKATPTEYLRQSNFLNCLSGNGENCNDNGYNIYSHELKFNNRNNKNW